jgi:hypothetical protein
MDRMKYSTILIGALSVAGFYYGINRMATGVVQEATTDTSNCFELIGSTTTEVDGLTKITGSIRNNCDRRFPNVQVSFKVERSTESSFHLPEPLVTASGHNVGPGGVWSFETFPITRGANYRLERMWGY